MVVFQPSKLATRVRFPSPALYSTVLKFRHRYFARIAQLVEHFIGNEEVSGSSPLPGLFRKKDVIPEGVIGNMVLGLK